MTRTIDGMFSDFANASFYPPEFYLAGVHLGTKGKDRVKLLNPIKEKLFSDKLNVYEIPHAYALAVYGKKDDALKILTWFIDSVYFGAEWCDLINYTYEVLELPNRVSVDETYEDVSIEGNSEYSIEGDGRNDFEIPEEVKILGKNIEGFVRRMREEDRIKRIDGIKSGLSGDFFAKAICHIGLYQYSKAIKIFKNMATKERDKEVGTTYFLFASVLKHMDRLRERLNP